MPPEYRSDANRVEFLKKAARDDQWALSTLESHMAAPMNFTTLHTRLSSDIVLHEELLTRHTNTRPTSYTPQVAPLYYGEQMPIPIVLCAKALFHLPSFQDPPQAATAAPLLRRYSPAGIVVKRDTQSTYVLI
jgi:hypothetical protein